MGQVGCTHCTEHTDVLTLPRIYCSPVNVDTVHVFDVLDIVTDAVCPCSDAEMKDVGLRGLGTLGGG